MLTRLAYSISPDSQRKFLALSSLTSIPVVQLSHSTATFTTPGMYPQSAYRVPLANLQSLHPQSPHSSSPTASIYMRIPRGAYPLYNHATSPPLVIVWGGGGRELNTVTYSHTYLDLHADLLYNLWLYVIYGSCWL